MINICKLYRKKWNMEIYFVKFNLSEYYIYPFLLQTEKMEDWFYVSENRFWKFTKIGKYFNIFVFFIKILCQSKDSSLSKQSSFSLTPPFLEKNISSPHLLPKKRNTIPLDSRMPSALNFCFLTIFILTSKKRSC